MITKKIYEMFLKHLHCFVMWSYQRVRLSVLMAPPNAGCSVKDGSLGNMHHGKWPLGELEEMNVMCLPWGTVVILLHVNSEEEGWAGKKYIKKSTRLRLKPCQDEISDSRALLTTSREALRCIDRCMRKAMM